MSNNNYVKFCPVCNETKQNTQLCYNNEKFREFTKGYFWLFEPKDENAKICPCCEKGILEDSILTHDEFSIIADVSDQDRNFLEAMIDLKKKDPIEYQLKMSKFKTQIVQQDQVKQAKKEDNIPKCPTCGSTNIRKIGGVERGASIVAFGIFSKKINKTFKCGNCGYTW